MDIQWRLGGRGLRPGRLFCIGKNYPAHVREMKDPEGQTPVVFMKPADSLVPPGGPVPFPAHGRVLHHEVEVVVLLGGGGRDIPESEALNHVAGLALGLDLTLRDLQTQLKRSGNPWELSKAFESSAPLGPMIPEVADPADIHFECRVDGELRQEGHTADMIFSIPRLIHYLSGVWALKPGDLIYTGTPAGVGPLEPGQVVTLGSDRLPSCEWRIGTAD